MKSSVNSTKSGQGHDSEIEQPRILTEMEKIAKRHISPQKGGTMSVTHVIDNLYAKEKRATYQRQVMKNANECHHTDGVLFNLNRAITHGHTKAIKEGGYISNDGYESTGANHLSKTKASTFVLIPEGLVVLAGSKANITKVHLKPTDNRKNKSPSKGK
jgi:hypothetical protein